MGEWKEQAVRKIVYAMNISLDGFLARPDGSLDWAIADEELHAYYTELLRSADTEIFGRVTYQMMVDYWPTAAGDPSLSKGEIEFANALNPLKKIVYSTTLTEVGWNTRLEREVDLDAIRQMKQEPGKDIVLGMGPSLLSRFVSAGLVDEYHLAVHPVVLGAGIRFVGPLEAALHLKLERTRTLASGVVALSYAA